MSAAGPEPSRMTGRTFGWVLEITTGPDDGTLCMGFESHAQALGAGTAILRDAPDIQRIIVVNNDTGDFEDVLRRLALPT